jgi:small-conductance mechanosensitive channel
MLLAILTGVLGWSGLRLLSLGIADRLRGTQVDPIVRDSILRILNIGGYLIVGAAVCERLGLIGGGTLQLAAALVLTAGLTLGRPVRQVAAGAMLWSRRPFNLGDDVRLGGSEGTEGTIEQVGLWTTTLRTEDGRLVVIPNDEALSGPIDNRSRSGRARVSARFPLPRNPAREAQESAIREALFPLGPSQVRIVAIHSEFLEMEATIETTPERRPEVADSLHRAILSVLEGERSPDSPEAA